MQITLNSVEIKQAIINFVTLQGIDLRNATVEVGMTAGRGPNGLSATVDIIPKGQDKSEQNDGVKQTYANVANLENVPTKVAGVDIIEQDVNPEVIDPPFVDDAISAEDDATLDSLMDPEKPAKGKAADKPAVNSIFK